MLPARKPVAEKPEARWRSQKHLRWLTKTFACAMCGSLTAVEAAHVRIGGRGGMGRKPDDWNAVPLCKTCHRVDQHTKDGEPDFWRRYEAAHGQSVDDLIDSLCAASPAKLDIKKRKEARR